MLADQRIVLVSNKHKLVEACWIVNIRFGALRIYQDPGSRFQNPGRILCSGSEVRFYDSSSVVWDKVLQPFGMYSERVLRRFGNTKHGRQSPVVGSKIARPFYVSKRRYMYNTILEPASSRLQPFDSPNHHPLTRYQTFLFHETQ